MGNIRQFKRDIYQSVSFVTASRANLLIAGCISVVSFLLFVVLTFPQYAAEMVFAGPSYWVEMIRMLMWLIVESSGYIGLVLVGVYAIMTGVLAVVVIGSVRYAVESASGLLTVLPAIVFSGCASCGAGVLGLLGAIGYATIFPFGGNLIRVIGILLVFLSLGWLGDPRKCEV